MKKAIAVLFLTMALGVVSAEVPPPPCSVNNSCPGAGFFASAPLVPMFLAGVYQWWANHWH